MYIWLNTIQGGVLTPETPPCVRLCAKGKDLFHVVNFQNVCDVFICNHITRLRIDIDIGDRLKDYVITAFLNKVDEIFM